MIFCFTHSSVPYPVIITEAPRQQTGTDAETHREALCKESVEIGGLHQIPALKAQEVLGKRKQKDCKSHREWRTPGEQGPLNQLSRLYMSLQILRQQAPGLHRSVPGFLWIYYSF